MVAALAPAARAEIFPGRPGSFPGSLVDLNGTLLFAADDGIHGTELWKNLNNGTPSTIVKDINLGNCGFLGNDSFPSDLVAFSGAAGGVVCSACEASGFAFSQEAHAFMSEALGRPLAEAPAAGERALRQVERAIADIAEHHGHTRLRVASRRL